MAGILAVLEIVGIGIARNRHWHTSPCLEANRRNNYAHFALKNLPARSTSPHRAHPQRLLEAILLARNHEAPVLRDRDLASRARYQRADRILLPVTTNLRLRRDRDDSLCGPMWPKLSMARVPYSLRAKIKQYTSFLLLKPPHTVLVTAPVRHRRPVCWLRRWPGGSGGRCAVSCVLCGRVDRERELINGRIISRAGKRVFDPRSSQSILCGP